MLPNIFWSRTDYISGAYATKMVAISSPVLVQERSSVMCTPRNLVLLTLSTVAPLMVRGACRECTLLKSTTISFVFSTFRERLLSLHHPARRLTSLLGSVLRTSLTQLAGFDCCRFRLILDHLVLRSSSWTCCHSNRSISLNLLGSRLISCKQD